MSDPGPAGGLFDGMFGASPDWLAAPLIRRPIADGVLTFTPDASREEAEKIVKGLNNVTEKIKKDPTELDGKKVTCSGGKYTTPSLGDGVHRFSVAATDAGGSQFETTILRAYLVTP